MKTAASAALALLFLLGAPESQAIEKDLTAELHSALRTVTRLHVRTGGTCHRRPQGEKTLLDLRDTGEIAEFVQNIQLDSSQSGFHCMCCGEPTLEFYNGDTPAAVLGFHHGRSLRWLNGKWEADALLTSTSATHIIRWLAQRKVTGPKEEVEAAERSAKESDAAMEQWLSAMPKSLIPFWNPGDFGDSPKLEKMRSALAIEIPDSDLQILALLGWYGSGAGPWSGFPAYEAVAEQLLLTHETSVILRAIQDSTLTDAQTEGAARLFGGWEFSQQRPRDLELLPDSLKQKLLKHSLKSDNQDKRNRARAAFENR